MPSNEPVALPDPIALSEPEPGEGYERTALTLTREDVLKHNARMRDMVSRNGAVRMQVAYFRCPWPVSEEMYVKVRKAAVDRWLRYMEQTGWVLMGRVGVRLDKRRWAHRLRGDWYSEPSLGEVEIPVAAAFKKQDMQIVRVEVPVVE